MQTQTIYTGIDISKSFFDVSLSGRHHQLSNDMTGFEALLGLLTKDSHVVMEASGPYYLRLACYLHAQQVKVSVINPLVIRRFSQMRMSRAKTDKKDARLIADYGAMTQPEQWAPPQRHLIALQQMEAILSGSVKQYTALSNQLESLSSSGMLEKELRKIIQDELVHRQQLIDRLSLRMQQIVQAHYTQMLANLKSIPGIGKKTAMMLILVSGGFDRFDDYRKLSSYIGICPRIFESGSSIKGKARICKMGMSGIRASLYVCSWSAKRCNKACRELYERLIAKGKAKKLALIAVANKLLKQAFAIAKQQTKYQENYSINTCF
jgi:transposase